MSFQTAIAADRYFLKSTVPTSKAIGTIDGRREIIHLDNMVWRGEDGVVHDQLNEPLPADIDYLAESTFEEMWQRLAAAAANTPKEAIDFYTILKDFYFVPGGRIMANLGSPINHSFYNCFVIPSPKDSRNGIMETLTQMVNIMAKGGGVGINFGSLRPKNARVRGVDGKSSGAVSWMELFSDATGKVSQGGSRRGALMVMLPVWHPDIEDFITAKKTPGRYTNCNMSAVITNAFMEAVARNADWPLMFPDTTYANYNEEWTGNMEEWVFLHRPVITHKTVNARELWNAICESAWSSGEPGIWFGGKANELSNSWYYDDLIATNPCGEQPLPAWGVCNLGALNLGKFVEDRNINYVKLQRTVELAVRFLDNIIDKNDYMYEENARQQKRERRVGLNFMGWADMLALLHIPYGSEESIELAHHVFKFIKLTAYHASVELAREKGAFPLYSTDYLSSYFITELPVYLQEEIKTHGIRNVTLLTAAPTGTTGTMVGASTGIEPYFALEWERKSRIGTHTERVSTYQGGERPEWLVTAYDLKPEQHVRMQAAIQKHVDAAISKTINLPASATVSDVASVYEMMYNLGCKGGTVYRDASRTEQVLTAKVSTDRICPECGEKLVSEAGCWHCTSCEHSVCER